MKLSQIPTPILPSWMLHDLDLQQARMIAITQRATLALEAEGSIYSYTIFQTVSTVSQMMALKQTFCVKETDPTVEAWLQKMTQALLADMEKIPDDACRKILQVLQTVTAESQAVGLLEELRNLFSRRLEARGGYFDG